MHALVLRQAKRYFKTLSPEHPEVRALLQAVSDAYEAYDDDRVLLERTLAIASQETEERYQALQRDVAARQRAENERDAFFQASCDLLTIVDDRLHVAQANESWQRLLGYQPQAVKGTPFGQYVHPDDLQRLMEKAGTDSGRITDFEFRMRDLHGHWHLMSATVTVDRQRGLFFSVCRDITDQRALEREREQSQKLEAVGQLASGVAHEINTPVQYVGDCLSFVGEGCDALFGWLDQVDGALTPEQQAQLADARRTADLEYYREEMPSSLRDGRDGVRRVAELVRALKEFAHPDVPEKTPSDINKALERAVTLARGEIKHVSRVDFDLGELPPLSCHIGSLSQVFLNLLVNAAHAIEERTQKENVPFEQHRITVRTRLELDEVVVSIGDTGCGIPEAIRERIYEPFFTTKPMGKGSGQGLPLVRNVVHAHGGRIELDSAPGHTTFTLRLPISKSAIARAA